MGIRSLLRNAFGRSKAARKSADKPESATIPEAREEAAPAPATAAPEAEVPAARTAPVEPVEPTPAPATASVPAQGGPVERAPEPVAKEEAPARVETPVRDEPAPAPEATAPTTDTDVARPADTEESASAKAADEGTQTSKGQGTGAHEDTHKEEKEDEKDETASEPAAEAQAPATSEPTDPASAADLVSQAFDNPAPNTAEATAPEPTTDAQPEKAESSETAEAPEKTNAAEAAESAGAPEETPAADDEAKPEPTSGPKPEPAPVAEATETAETTETPAPRAANPVAAAAPALLPLYNAARATLEKHQLTDQRATVYLVLDRSGSMRNYYKDGTVQHLAEQALALSAHFDEEATVPVVFFSTDVDGTTDLDLTNHEGRIEELHSGLGHMGRTNYHWAIEAVVKHYKASGSTRPAFVIFQTDGAPTSKPAAERALCEAADLPIFWQFIGFGDPDAKGFDFLRKLDDLTVPEKRAVDNAGFFHAGRDPRGLSHDELYQQLMVEFPEWLAEARAAKVLKDS
ncbi:VWA domain-containing protein [Streptomyces sp. BHT-5-2]|uniref:vWA domain-containing protein n=1 Tax=Streptomyces sp. BHT-5-2 TaxID=2866715 RepID=UPI001C8DD38D|nr:VWA domain-containing protein [Streptomyces sp. BHT-5-2]QZL02827.1 VWA domain-containing protein [Streptomyces sp. BHT-5-2]